MPLGRPDIPRIPGYTGRARGAAPAQARGGAAAQGGKREPAASSHAKGPASRRDVQLKSSLEDLDIIARASTDSPLNQSISREGTFDGMPGFIPVEINAALKRLQARLDALSALGMSPEEAVERGMIPGLALKRFEASARKLQALSEVGVSFERGVDLGLVEAEHLEVYDAMLAQFETLDTLGVSYEEGVRLGFISDGVVGVGLPPAARGCQPASSPLVTSSTAAPSVASSQPSRPDAAAAAQPWQQAAAEPEPERGRRGGGGGGFSFHVGPGGIACYCAGAADGVDEHEVA